MGIYIDPEGFFEKAFRVGVKNGPFNKFFTYSNQHLINLAGENQTEGAKMAAFLRNFLQLSPKYKQTAGKFKMKKVLTNIYVYDIV